MSDNEIIMDDSGKQPKTKTISYSFVVEDIPVEMESIKKHIEKRIASLTPGADVKLTVTYKMAVKE